MSSYLIAIFSCNDNLPYLTVCLERLLKAITSTKSGFHFNTVVFDFGETPFRVISGTGYRYVHRPRAGFCNNFNAALDYAHENRVDYLVNINDDSAIHKVFIEEGIKFLDDNPRVAFVGGVPSRGKWGEPLSELHIPEPQMLAKEIENIGYLQWEASGAMYRVEAVKEIGGMDTYFDPHGYIADSELMFRLKKAGWMLFRNYMMTFWHSKGQSQMKYRIPNPNNDPIRDRAIRYVKEKHGWDMSKSLSGVN
jgi:cellulose synthase/poly-beta-1,6-N-acetylglucosamine synthase-like glycosyltransferase